jgi:hypothetical protein
VPRLGGLSIAILSAGGGLLILAGIGVIVLGLVDPELVSSRIPDSVIDTAAVGGAMVALGSGTVLLGLVHLASVLAVGLKVRGAATGAVVLAAGMAVLAFAFSVAALVSAIAGTAPSILMLPASAGLLLATIGYALAAVGLLGATGPPN